ncbi:hypothetical protein BJ138DRAFT_1143814 [Hygrophoropsis aurantiaca]|uniref:Uncharacterized protein n=1 Tax=Hygrophoropsis aurantiaca TaxID=72124 RepID=A0ACB8AMJ1_9AGAM|nr:hypothetical protein BJ138DRAFT_1143814 [Hygrophoropsis aurantiaca]
MAHAESLTMASLTDLLTIKGAYLLAYGWLYGMSIWISFFGGIIAYRSLPKHQFGALQHRTFPVYFASSVLLSSVLLALWAYTHAGILSNLARPSHPDVAQAYALGSVTLFQGINQFVVGPLTSKTMFKRHKLEKEEGKSYHEPNVSAEMKALNSRFGMLHGISSVANLGAVIALGFHGLWLGNNGL